MLAYLAVLGLSSELIVDLLLSALYREIMLFELLERLDVDVTLVQLTLLLMMDGRIGLMIEEVRFIGILLMLFRMMW